MGAPVASRETRRHGVVVHTSKLPRWLTAAANRPSPLTAIPSSLMPADPSLADYRATLWLMPAVLVVGLIAATMLRQPAGAVRLSDTGS